MIYLIFGVLHGVVFRSQRFWFIYIYIVLEG